MSVVIISVFESLLNPSGDSCLVPFGVIGGIVGLGLNLGMEGRKINEINKRTKQLDRKEGSKRRREVIKEDR